MCVHPTRCPVAPPRSRNHEILLPMPPSGTFRVPLSFSTACPAEARRGEPVSCGIPWPQGVLTDPARLWLSDSRGQAAVLQTRVLDRWPDGSVRWLLLDWLATDLGGTTATLFAPGPPGEPVGARLKVQQAAAEIIV